ncbi:hypothetical protein [Rheinheimera soli]|uniref:hypothetical protein n=1 Tax=Rheinheimera soli TaxID=443616 RepID=UPI00286B9277|nr:hypothetical protein [Rheinheimera soli]
MSSEIKVTTRIGASTCDVHFKNKTQYAVFAIQTKRGLEVSSCSSTIHTDKGSEHYEKKRLNVISFLSKKNGT